MNLAIGTTIAVSIGLLTWWVSEAFADRLDDVEVRRALVEIATTYRLHAGFSDCDLLTASAVPIDLAVTALEAADILFPLRSDFSDWTFDYERTTTRGGLNVRFNRMDGVTVVEQFDHEIEVAGLSHGQTFVSAAFGRSC